MNPRDELRALPKAHLHLHLEGAARTGTIASFARRQARPAPILDDYVDLTGFVAAYEGSRDLIEDLADLRRVAKEVAEDALDEGFVWLEVHLSPWSYRGRLGNEEAVLDAALDGLNAPQRPHTGAAIILGHNRADPPEAAEQLVDLAIAYRDSGVVGVGLVGDERHPASPFASAFQRARTAGLASVPHAGEAAGPERVREAIDLLGAERIGHGVRAVEDPALLAELASRGVCLDVCPTSNLRLGIYGDHASHPLRHLIAAGVPVTLNSDDPTFFGQSALDEYVRADSAGIDVEAVARDSLRLSRAPERVLGPALSALQDRPASTSG